MFSTPPTYLTFLAVAVVPVVGALGVRALVRSMATRRWAGVGLMVGVALAYTTPWDNALVRRGVWWYGEGTVLATVWYAPVGEYLFVGLQAVAVALWLYAVLDWTGATVPYRFGDVGGYERLGGALAGVAVGGGGVALLARPSTYYLGAILAWSGPVLALQWGFAPRYLWLRRRTLLAAVGAPTAYLCAIDRVAIELGIWTIAPGFTTGVAPVGLPVEEAVFFLLTTLFVVQGLVLLEWVLAGQVEAVLERVGVDAGTVRAAVER